MQRSSRYGVRAVPQKRGSLRKTEEKKEDRRTKKEERSRKEKERRKKQEGRRKKTKKEERRRKQGKKGARRARAILIHPHLPIARPSGNYVNRGLTYLL